MVFKLLWYRHMIVGLTGGIGSGKSTVCAMFAELGVPTTNADDIAKQILATNHTVFNQIVKKFHQDTIATNNSIDRKKLRTKIFNSEQDRKWLEQIMHPLIMQQIATYAANIHYPYCVIEIPLLLESKLEGAVDQILVVDSPKELQVERAAARDKTSAEEIHKIINTQLTREERLKCKAKFIENSSDLTNLKKQVSDLHHHYLALAKAKNI